MEKRGTSHSALYGHACRTCVKAKCRCIPRPGDDACERCHRLKKHCAPSNSIRRRPVDQEQNSGTDNHERVVSVRQSRVVSDGSAGLRLPQRLQHTRVPAEQFKSVEPFVDPYLALNDTTNVTSTNSVTAAARLDTFRSHMLPHFPFIHLPTDLTPHRLQLDHPFLFRAIICVASPTAQERQARAIDFKRVLVEAAFPLHSHQDKTQADGIDRKIDLLLGLLTYAAWGWDYAQLPRLVMLATSLIGELRLDKPAPPDVRTLELLTPLAQGWGRTGGDNMITPQSFERQRAVLGCFVLSSVVSTYAGQVDALRWTPQMEGSLAALSAGEECPTDAALVLQVRLQLLATRAFQLRDQDHRMNQFAAEELLQQLQELRPAVQQHHEGTLTAQAHHTELCIHETIHLTNPTLPTVTVAATACLPPSSRTNTTAPPNFPQSLHHPRQILLSIQSCTSALLALPPASFKGISFAQWAQLTRCIVALHRLDTPPTQHAVPDPRWDAAAVRTVVDLPVLLDAVGKKLEKAARDAEEDKLPAEEGVGVFTRLLGGVRAFREVVVRGREAGSGSEGRSMDGSRDDGVEGMGVLPPQKGYFVNPRFWLDQFFIRED